MYQYLTRHELGAIRAMSGFKTIQEIFGQRGTETGVTTLDGLNKTTRDLSRNEMKLIRNIVAERITDPALSVSKISGTEVRDQTIVVVIDKSRYPVPVRVFAQRDISFIQKQIKYAHETSEK